MGKYDKIETDQLWIRSQPNLDQLEGTRTHGQHYPYFNAPNTRERIEMSYRSIGKQHDWEMEKFRASTKPADKGNKRRFFKNFARMVKNPAAYFFWKSRGLFGNTSLFGPLLISSLIGTVLFLNHTSKQKRKMKKYLELEGEPYEGSGLDFSEFRDSKMGYQTTAIWRMLYSTPSIDNFVINPTVDQPFRKYFDRMVFK